MNETTVTEKNVLYGGPDSPEIDPDAKSFGEMAIKQLLINRDRVLYIDGITLTKVTGIQLLQKVIHLANCMTLAGIKEGDSVSICSENRLEFPEVIMATLFLGATVAPLNVTYSVSELNHAVNLSHPKLLFASLANFKNVMEMAKKNSFIKRIVVFSDKPVLSGLETYNQFVDPTKYNSTIEGFTPKPVDRKNNVALILCSSGTTGLPKGVQLTQFNVSVSTNQIYEAFQLMRDAFEDGSPTALSIIPWFHAYGVLTLIAMLVVGLKTVFLPKFEEKSFLNAIEQCQVNLLFAVPPLMVFLAKHPLVDKYNLSSLLTIYCGAAPLSKEIEDAVKERIGVMAVRQGFGMSEMTLSVLSQNPENESAGSVGVLRPGIYGKIINPDTGETLGVNEQGEMCFKGSAVMKGYIGDAQATSAVIDKNGWLRTGDIGYYNEQFEWFIVDRIKELIKFKGFQVPPAEIEAILLTHPKVSDAAVIGLPDEATGELPLGFIVKQSGVDLTEQEVIDFVASKTSYAKRLHGGVRFINEIPKNPSGKILRRELREFVKSSKKSKL